MEMDFCGPSLPPRFRQGAQLNHGSDPTSEHSEQPEWVCSVKAIKHFDRNKHKVWEKYIKQSSSSEEPESSIQVKKLAQPKRAPYEHDIHETYPDPVFYREVGMSDLPPQYAEEIETFKHILKLPDPRDTMPRSPTTILGLDDEKGQQELRPRDPSAKLLLSPYPGLELV